MTVASTVAGAFTLAVGFVLAVVGWLIISAGRGGYGRGPFPMIPVPTDYRLIGMGVVFVVVGCALTAAGWEVLA